LKSATGEAEAKGKALRAELEAARKKNNALKEQIEEQDKELLDLRPGAKTLSENLQTLLEQNLAIEDERRVLQQSVARLTEQNQQMFEKSQKIDEELTLLGKTNQEKIASLAKEENENRTLTEKNHHLSDETERLEKESERYQKEKLALGQKVEALTDSKNALEVEVRALKEKPNGTRDPKDDDRYIFELRARNDKLRNEKAILVKELQVQDDDLRTRQDAINKLRRQSEVDRSDMMREIRILEGETEDLKHQIDDLREKTDAHKAANTQLLKENQMLKAQVVALQHPPPLTEPKTMHLVNGRGTPKAISPADSSTVTDISDPVTTPPNTTRPKRKMFDLRPIDDQNNLRVVPAGSNASEKRQKLEPSAPIATSNAPYKRRSATYLVTVQARVDENALIAALSTLNTEIEGLRRVLYLRPGEEEDWVVKYFSAPRDFKKQVFVGAGTFATLTAGTGTTCLICANEPINQHDIWECRFLAPLGPQTQTQNPPGEVISPRSLFERVSFPLAHKDPPRRSLFDRVDNNNPRGHELKINRLLDITRTQRRALFCRFTGYFPQAHEFLSIISGGPIESAKLTPAARVGFVDFVYPDDAERFLNHAIANINGKQTVYGGAVEFKWSDTCTKPIDRFIAEGIVCESWSRVIILEAVPKEVSQKQIMKDCTGARLFFWTREGVTKDKEGRRDVEVEFLSVKEAELAKKKLVEVWYCRGRVRWGVEDCTRMLDCSV
jgi:hypothetical protein